MNLFRFFLMFWLKRDVRYERSSQHRGLRPSSWEVVARITNSPWNLKNDEMAQNDAFSFSFRVFLVASEKYLLGTLAAKPCRFLNLFWKFTERLL